MREYLPLGSTDAETAAMGESLLSPRGGGASSAGDSPGGGARKGRFGTPRFGTPRAGQAGLQPLFEGQAGAEGDVEGGQGGGGPAGPAPSPRTPAPARCGGAGAGCIQQLPASHRPAATPSTAAAGCPPCTTHRHPPACRLAPPPPLTEMTDVVSPRRFV